MGIPAFFSRMTAAGYAECSKEIGHRGERAHTYAIIDAPAFAYYILGIAEENSNSSGSTGTQIGSAATYADCALAAVQWLEDLEKYGIIVEAIFFDGALPATKRSTRVKRLTQLAVDVDLYRKRHEKLLTRKASDGELAEFRRTQRDLIPPFLVPAVQEALLSSRFKNIVFGCPGEADDFCVAAARKAGKSHPGHRVAIFTNDSDLAVFNSGVETRINLLNTFEIHKNNDTGDYITATQFWPARIAARIRCSNLIELAFHLSQNPGDSVAKVLTWIEPGKLPRDRAFQKFSDIYEARVEHILAQMQIEEPERQLRLGLDARVAELIHQARTKTGLTARSPDFEIFLPFLIEDSSRASAWRIGSAIRDVAYKILLDACECPKNAILEHKRVGNGINSRKTTGVSDKMFQAELHRLKKYFSCGSAWELPCTVAERWRFAITKLMAAEFEREDMMLPRPEELIVVLRGYPCTHWHNVQLSTFFQAMFYSLRLLLQVMRYADRTNERDKKERISDPKKLFKPLLNLLEGMPGIADFLQPDPDMEKTVSEAEWTERFEVCLRFIDENRRPYASEAEKRMKKERKEKKKHKKIFSRETGAKKLTKLATVDESEEDELDGNPFAALARE
ncbi:hypothetical protein B0A55_06701 [Friedmanniomyces simplex]|uniref:Asteroid domain-containing protein n=1 Tax=Friedmanniomyces simplex TaxID=329884 RepID=A0A4U0X2S2_9PEZI|nr:hypothetical protein B0A55_06701 [Friedmanniomyces simplex]